jgi:hypothetical protein
MISDCGSELLAPGAFKAHPNHSLKAMVRPVDGRIVLVKGIRVVWLYERSVAQLQLVTGVIKKTKHNRRRENND